MGRLKSIPQLKNGGNVLPKTGIGGKNNRTASIPNKPGDKAIGNGSKPQDIAKDMRDKVGEAVKNLNSPNEPSQEPESIEEPMPDPGSLIDEVPQQSLAGSLNNPGSLNAGNGGLDGNGNNGKDKNGKKKKTPMDKLKGKVKRAVIQAILSHLIPIFIGVMAFGAIGSCSAAMFTGGDNTEIEQTRGQNRKIIINGGSNSNTSSSNSSGGGTPFDGDWVYYDQLHPTTWGSSDAAWTDGCGVVSEAMVLSTYAKDTKYNPSWMLSEGLVAGGGGHHWLSSNFVGYVNSHQDIFHLKVTEKLANETWDGHITMEQEGNWKNDWDQVKKVCAAGGCVMIGQDTISATSKAHYIVIQKVENGTVSYANPATGKQETIEESKLRSYGYSVGNNTQTMYFEKV